MSYSRYDFGSQHTRGVGAVAAQDLGLSISDGGTINRSPTRSRLPSVEINPDLKVTSTTKKDPGMVLTRHPTTSLPTAPVSYDDPRESEPDSDEMSTEKRGDQDDPHQTPPIIDPETLEEMIRRQIQEQQDQDSTTVKNGGAIIPRSGGGGGGGKVPKTGGKVDPWRSPPFYPGPPPLVLPEKDPKPSGINTKTLLIGAAILGGAYLFMKGRK